MAGQPTYQNLNLPLSYTPEESKVISINIHDTYFIISIPEIDILLCSILVIHGFTYLILSRMKITLIKTLTKTHIFVTIGSILCFKIGFLSTYKHFFKSPSSPFNHSNHETDFIMLLITLLVIAQVLFLLNIIISLFRHGLQRTTR